MPVCERVIVLVIVIDCVADPLDETEALPEDDADCDVVIDCEVEVDCDADWEGVDDLVMPVEYVCEGESDAL